MYVALISSSKERSTDWPLQMATTTTKAKTTDMEATATTTAVADMARDMARAAIRMIRATSAKLSLRLRLVRR